MNTTALKRTIIRCIQSVLVEKGYDFATKQARSLEGIYQAICFCVSLLKALKSTCVVKNINRHSCDFTLHE